MEWLNYTIKMILFHFENMPLHKNKKKEKRSRRFIVKCILV